MMMGMAKGGLDFLTSIPMKITNIIGAKVRFIQGIGQAKMQFLGNIGNKFAKLMKGGGGSSTSRPSYGKPNTGYGTPTQGYGAPSTSRPSYNSGGGDSYGAPQGPVQARLSSFNRSGLAFNSDVLLRRSATELNVDTCCCLRCGADIPDKN